MSVHTIEYSDGRSIELEFDPKKHYYMVDGAYVPATTTVLDNKAKPALLPWAASMGARWFLDNTSMVPEQKDREPYPVFINGKGLDDMAKGIRNAFRKSNREAIQIGQDAHQYCQEAIEWKLGQSKKIPALPKNELTANSVNAFRNWVKEHEIKWYAAELKVYNRTHKYAGTVDAVAEVDDEFCVIDFKTSKAVYSSHHLQCAAYADCVEDIYGKDVDCSYVLRLDKTSGEFEAAKSTEMAENLNGFLGFLAGYRRITALENSNGR